MYMCVFVFLKMQTAWIYFHQKFFANVKFNQTFFYCKIFKTLRGQSVWLKSFVYNSSAEMHSCLPLCGRLYINYTYFFLNMYIHVKLITVMQFFDKMDSEFFSKRVCVCRITVIYVPLNLCVLQNPN